MHFLSHGQVCEACKGRKYYRCAMKRCRKGNWLKSSVAMLGSYMSDYIYRYDTLISAYVTPSEFMRQKMIEFGYSPDKLITLPNAYFGNVVEAKQSPRRHILYAGRLSPEKGVDLLIFAAKGLNEIINIAGDGPERENLQRLAQNLGVDNVRFLGFQNGQKLNDLYQTALMLVLPSRWYENGPLVLLEAFANAVPVAGARIGAVPEFMEDGQTGFLFSPNDANELRWGLQNSLARPERLRQMGEVALARVQARYSPAAYVAGLEAIFKQVVS